MNLPTFKGILLSFAVCFLNLFAFGQVPCAHSSCDAVHCMGIIGLQEQHDSFIPPPEGFVPYQERDVVISVSYNGFTPEAQAAFQYAVDIWASLLTSNVPILVEATWEDIEGNTLGFAGPTGLWQNFTGAPDNNVLYPSALADKLNNADLEPGQADIVASFDSGTNWYLGTDGNPGGGQFDFVSVVLHELGHGLGVVGTAVVENDLGFFLNSNPSVYDIFVENGDNTPITTFDSGTNELFNQFTGNDLFWDGGFAVANNGGDEPKLYAPGSWAQGSSYSHVDENTYPAGTGNSLMTPFIAPGEAIHDPGPIILGLMEDIGWTVGEPEPCTANVLELTILPDCYGSEITWQIFDETEGDLVASGGPYANSDPENIVAITQEVCLEDGCYIFAIQDSFGDGLAGSQEAGCGVDGDFFLTDSEGTILVEMDEVNYGFGANFVFCAGEEIAGCQDPDACNFDPDATIDFGCDYPQCGDPTAVNYNPDAACFDNTLCQYFEGEIEVIIEVEEVVDQQVGDVDLTGYLTYHVYALIGEGNRLQSMYSQSDIVEPVVPNEFDIVMDAPCGCYQNEFGGLTAANVNCNIFPFFPEAEYDTWFTIEGESSCDFNGELNFAVSDPPSLDPTLCPPPINDGSVFTAGAVDLGVAGPDGKVLIAQVTTCGELTFQACFGVVPENDTNNETVYGCAEDTYIPVIACTDPNATNYNAQAILDDGSCLYDGVCTPTDLTLSQNCFWDEMNMEVVNRILVEPTLSGDCTLEEVCVVEVGTSDEVCFFLPDFDIFVGNGDGVFIPVPGPGTYEVFATTAEGVSSVEVFTVDCSDAVLGCGNPFALNFSPLVEVNIPELCEYDDFICDCAGTQHTSGVLTWLGDGFLDDGSFEWENQPVDFNCATWGFDCADGGVENDPNGVCDGNLPPNNGCSGCTPLDMEISQAPCLDSEFGLQPVIQFIFNFPGGCTVEDLCLQEDGQGYECFNLPDLEFVLESGEGLVLTETLPNVSYDFYYTTSDGSQSTVFSFENGDCSNEVQICDCSGTQHSIGVLTWLGDDFEDDGSFDWEGEPVNFNCATWGFDCGDFGINNDPNGVCEGNLPPNNGCVGEITGCTDPSAINYNPAATLNDGSCIYDLPGCNDLSACNYDPEATVNDGSCDYSCYGCTNPSASNYDPAATIDDGSCEFDLEGCTDVSACNYDPQATVDDGSCDFSCYGCTDPTASNYDPDATIDDGSCQYETEGCTDDEACNYDPEATVDDGSCDFSCYGCTDDEACNFDENATVDDGSCEYESCTGCTDETALNYDPTALIDDGSCIFECVLPEITFNLIGCNDGEAGFYVEFDAGDLGNAAPYIIGNSENGETETLDETGTLLIGPFDDGVSVDFTFTSEAFDECVLEQTDVACPVSVSSTALENVRIYPNPVNRVLSIQTGAIDLKEWTLFDLTGKRVSAEVVSDSDERIVIDVKHLSEGMYFLTLNLDNATITHRVVVQH